MGADYTAMRDARLGLGNPAHMRTRHAVRFGNVHDRGAVFDRLNNSRTDFRPVTDLARLVPCFVTVRAVCLL